MVPIQIHLPASSSDTAAGNRDIREVMREKTAQAEVLYNLIGGTATEGFKSRFFGQRHIALELIATNGLVHFFAAVPVAMVSVVQKAIQTAYPGARLEEVEDHNIFNQQGRLAATMGGEMLLKADSGYPIATYAQLERDPMEAIITTLSGLGKDDGAAIQLMIRPAASDWTKHSIKLTEKLRKGRHGEMKFTAMDLAKAAVKSPTAQREESKAFQPESMQLSKLQLSTIEQIEEKTQHPGFEVLVRVVVSTQTVAKSQQLLRDVATAYSLFELPGLNGFKFLPAVDVQGLVTAFIFRFFPPELHSSILNSVELATLFHLPDAQFTPTANVERQQSKQVDGPVTLPTTGLLFGYNEFRGVNKEIKLSVEDRRRHTYVLGQTGTGKSTLLENLAVQDMLAGGGFAFIDPHGDSAEKLLSLVPKNRAEDVIYFNPADTEYPLGLNLFEFNDPSQKDFIVQETIGMLYKLYDPGHTGIIGPRYEHWYRNAALTLMSDPNCSTFIEIPKVFTDTEYLKSKFRYLKDPTVIDFWTKEMGQTSDYHKSEMLGWFVSKFGAFQNNEMMRNIIGQTKSAFNLRDVMDQKKILIVNLSKGRIGELNSQLLGMIFVIKFQAAAMSRAEVPEADRADFSLYVDEFQNFSTDSFATILSEARKYRLNLIVANQFIGQLSNEIRDAVFGNIGSIVAHRMGPEDAEFMVKQFAPVFDARDLVNIPNYNAAMRLMIGGLPSQPFTMRDLPPLGNPNAELGLAIKQLSAAKFGLTKSVVEADILTRLSGRTPEPVSAAPVSPSVGEPDGPPAPPANAPSPAPVNPAPSVAAAPIEPAAMVSPPSAPTSPASVEPASIAAAPPAPAVAPSLPLGEPAQPVPAAPAPPVVIDSAPAVAEVSLAMTPPPIGAPPVDLGPAPADSKPAAEVVASPAPGAGGLSISDITGGKPSPRLPDVELIPLGAEPPLPPAPTIPDPLADVPLLASAPPALPPAPIEPPVIAAEKQAVPEPLVTPREPEPVKREATPEPEPRETSEPTMEPKEAPEPEPRQAPEPIIPETAPEADTAAPEPVAAEDLIHFVDPKLEAVLDSPTPASDVMPLPALPKPPVDTTVVQNEPISQPADQTTVQPIASPEPSDSATPASAAPERSTEEALADVMAAAGKVERGEVAPTLPAAPSTLPTAAAVIPSPPAELTPSAAVAAAEHEIDELLNDSLIQSDSPAQPPELIQASPPPDDKRHWLGNAVAEVPTDTGDEAPADVMLDGGPDRPVAPVPQSAAGGQRVIEPSAPIVSRRDEFESVLAKLEPNAGLDGSVSQVETEAIPAAVVLPEQPVAPPPAVPSASVSADPIATVAPGAPAPTSPETVKDDSPEPVDPIPFKEDALPEAESLLASDVAAKPVEPEPPSVPEPVSLAEPSVEPTVESTPPTVETPPVAAPEPPKAPDDAPDHEATNQKQTSRRRRGNREKLVEPAPEEPMAGKLIMPTATPKVEPAPGPKLEVKPPKLAPGEIYVDATGNVIVGE